MTASSGDIDQAVHTLRAGGLVAFPTETVYGLGADAENGAAVQRIFQVKSRPERHPLIVHFGDVAWLGDWVEAVPPLAETLARRFWPGPLTIILRKGQRIPATVTGGLETVGLRVPKHPVALQLLRAFGGAVAAPSANRFGCVSPTRADHVRADLGDAVDCILDGGASAVGIESTIVDLSSDRPAILRPGAVTREELEQVVGAPVPVRTGGPVRSPGQSELHYAPRAQVILAAADELYGEAKRLSLAGRRVVIVAGSRAQPRDSDLPMLLLPESLDEQARVLYETLREVDRLGYEVALISLPANAGIGLAIADRLCRAAGPRP